LIRKFIKQYKKAEQFLLQKTIYYESTNNTDFIQQAFAYFYKILKAGTSNPYSIFL